MMENFQEPIKPLWEEIDSACEAIASRVNQYEKPDYVIGLTRGGLIPAVILSHMLKIPMIPVSYSSAEGEGEYKQYTNDLPMIISSYQSGSGDLNMPTLLIVDDICDSGNTLTEVNDVYEKRGHAVYVAAIHYKESANFIPDVYWKSIPHNAPWVIYPWE